MARPKKTEAVIEPQVAEEPVLEPVVPTADAKVYVTVTPVYGPMHHPFQNISINGPTPVEMDNWVEVQIDAGKLTRC